jgi:hypothetical protein
MAVSEIKSKLKLKPLKVPIFYSKRYVIKILICYDKELLM